MIPAVAVVASALGAPLAVSSSTTATTTPTAADVYLVTLDALEVAELALEERDQARRVARRLDAELQAAADQLAAWQVYADGQADVAEAQRRRAALTEAALRRAEARAAWVPWLVGGAAVVGAGLATALALAL